MASGFKAGGGGEAARRLLRGGVAGWWRICPSPVEVVRRRPGSGAEAARGAAPADVLHQPSDPAPRSWWTLRLFDAMVLGALLLHSGGLRLEFVEVGLACCSGAALWFSPVVFVACMLALYWFPLL